MVTRMKWLVLCLFLTGCNVPERAGGLDNAVGPVGRAPESGVTEGGVKERIEKTPGPVSGERSPIIVTVQDAIVLALENNISLRVERLTPAIRRTFEDQERAEFDPVLTAGGAFSREKGPVGSGTPSTAPVITASEGTIEVGAFQFFPTGTDVEVDLSSSREWSDRAGNRYGSRVGLSVTQALLRGMGPAVNLANLRQARLDTRISEYELRGFSESLVARVELAYWDYALAQRQIKIVEESLRLAEEQLGETEEMIRVGRMAETEMAAAKAEIAFRRQNLINVRSTTATNRLRLLRLLNPPGSSLWDREILLKTPPTLPREKLDDVATHVQLALRMRPDLNQARLGVERGDLEIVKTKNGLLPKLDLFVTLGKTGFADSFGSSVSDVTGDTYDLLGGIKFEYPPRNRDARARHERSLLSHDQAEEAVQNLAQLVDLDVREAYIEVNRSEAQIEATKATRQLDEEKLRVETERFRVGRSTNILVAQAQRDLLLSRLLEIEAVANYLKALVNLYRLEGSLLERRGVRAPGREPAKLPDQKPR